MAEEPHGPTIAVVGGGITGLCAARFLSAQHEYRVVLIEADHHVGGKLRTGEVEGVRVERGADSFATEPDAAVKLCESLGLQDELVEPAIFGAQLWVDGKVRRLPSGFPSGIPVRPLDALRSGALSVGGSVRAAAEVLVPGALEEDDVAIGDYVRRRFGPEVLRRLVDPVLAGTRAGRPEQMSLRAAAPNIYAVARRRRSLLLGLRDARRRGELSSASPVFCAPRAGMQRLVASLEASLDDVDLVAGRRVETISPMGAGYRLDMGGDGALIAEGVLLCVPAFEAARLVRALSPEAADLLAAIRYASVALATLVLPPEAASFPEGSGMLVGASEGRALTGCTWYSIKWPHIAPDDGSLVIRCFVGRAERHPALDLEDAALVARLSDELDEALEVRSRPYTFHVERWERALPQYEVGHVQRVERVRAALAGHPTVALAGAAYEGASIPDCIQQAEAGGRRILDALRRAGRGRARAGKDKDRE